MATHRETLSAISVLIETVKDGEKGYALASDSVDNPQLKSLFRGYCRQRWYFAKELQVAARLFGERDPENTGSTSGAMHRTWMDLRSAVASKQEHAILAECERGENSAVKEYAKATDNSLPAPLDEIVSRHYKEIKSSHDHIRSLRDKITQS